MALYYLPVFYKGIAKMTSYYLPVFNGVAKKAFSGSKWSVPP
jgi:hypothetical protein